jgi:hypothetical protein
LAFCVTVADALPEVRGAVRIRAARPPRSHGE